jgi:hypothetical protein
VFNGISEIIESLDFISILRYYYYYYYYYYYLLTAIGLMPDGSVYKGFTVNKEHSTPVSRKDATYMSRISQYNTNTVAQYKYSELATSILKDVPFRKLYLFPSSRKNIEGI